MKIRLSSRSPEPERSEIGEGMSKVHAEFDRACGDNPAFPAVGLCFPDATVVTTALSNLTVDYWSDDFLATFHEVFLVFFSWPSAWPGIPQLLDPGQPWTQAYCERVIGSGSWSPFAFFSINLEPIDPLLRSTLGELQEDFPEAFIVLSRWFDALRLSRDPETRRLLQAFEAQDARNTREKVLRFEPLEKLLQHLLAQVINHLLTEACAHSEKAISVLEKKDKYGLTVLHLAALQGNTAMAEVILRAMPAAKRASYASAHDRDGYSAADQARLNGFLDTAARIEALGGDAGGQAPRDAIKLFQTPSQLRGFETGAGHDLGGWSISDAGLVPASWLPMDALSEVDSIDVSQFDWEIFEGHYVRQGRPLLVRGGAQYDDGIRRCYTREGLLDVAGQRLIHAFNLPYADDLCNHRPTVKTIREYVTFLDTRLRSAPEKNLSYVFIELPEGEQRLDFASTLPEAFHGRVRQLSTQFTLGGVLMGSPMHHHIHAVNSLMHGRKLWFFKPPAQQEFRKTVIYEDLVNSRGAPGVARCIQEAGDLLFVPSGWVHGAICLCDCIGVAHEFELIEPEFDDFADTFR